MANFFKNNFVVGITSGLVAAIIAPVLMPALKRSTRPLTKGMIKGGMLVYEKGREMTAHAGEMVEDVMAEIHAEEAAKTSGNTGKEEWSREPAPNHLEAGRNPNESDGRPHSIGQDGSLPPTHH